MGFVVEDWNWTEGRKWMKMSIIKNPGPCVSERNNLYHEIQQWKYDSLKVILDELSRNLYFEKYICMNCTRTFHYPLLKILLVTILEVVAFYC